MARSIDKIRNIGIIAHIDAGKTTLTERMLYFSKVIHRAGDVDKGTTTTDDDPEEQQRGITIYAACVTFPWKDVSVNLLDTPGHVDFTAEVERCLRVLDGAVVVFSAREGVEAQSETVWRQADRYKVPRVVFINKLDREGADFYGTLKEIASRLNAKPVPIQIPLGMGPPHMEGAFRGVVDLIEMKLLTFSRESNGQEITVSEIPEEVADDAHIWHDQMLESLYEFSDELTELALDKKPIPPELIRKTIREATLQMKVQPLFCGTALDFIGVQPVLDAVQYYLPSPLDRPPVQGTDPNPKKQDQVLLRKPDPNEPFCGLVFKVLPSKHGDFVWVRVYSGKLKANSRALNPGKDKKENVAQLWQIHATKKEEQIDSVGPGEIVGLIGPRDSITGDTLCDPKDSILLERITFPETVISMAIEAESTTERKKLAEVLEMLKKQDPTFRAQENEETGQTIISGMGELHLEVKQHLLQRDFNLKVKVHKPRVSYRETVDHSAEAVGECTRVLGGTQLFAKLKVRMEPFPKGSNPVTVINQCPPEAMPREWLDAALDELRGRGEGGGFIGGFPLMKLKITVLGGETNDHSSDVAFRIAAADAFENGLRAAGPILLEPIMKLDIITPDDYLGDIVGDLQMRRAIIVGTGNRGNLATIEAHAPLAELFGYSSAIRSLSQGRASCSMEPREYAPAPEHVAQTFAM